MPFFKSLPPDAGVRHILPMNKPVGRALIALHEALLRGDSPLTPAQHELIAAYVSGLNESRMRPLLEYVRRLTLSPHQLVQADADTVFAAGWSERELHDAILTTCLFNFMNRLLDGHGCEGNTQVFKERGRGLARDGYAPLLRLLE